MNKAEAKVDNFTQYSYTSITFISFTGRYEHIFDKLPTAVASYLSWLGHRTGIASSRVQLPLKSWIFFSFLRSCINCVDTTARIILHLILNKSLYFVNPFVGLVQKFTGMLEQSIRLLFYGWICKRAGWGGSCVLIGFPKRPISRYFLRRSRKKKFSFWT